MSGDRVSALTANRIVFVNTAHHRDTPGRPADLALRAMMGEVDIAVGRLLPFATGLGLDEMALRLIVLVVWTDSVERTGEVRRRLMRAAGA